MKNRLFFLMVCTCVAVAFMLTAGCACSDHRSHPTDIVFHYGWEGDIDNAGMREPSGIVYHPGREALIAVGDEGHIARLNTDGSEQQIQVLRKKADLEGITVNPATGLLYVALEGKDRVLEVDPDSMEVVREFQIDRNFKGETVFEPGGNGMEAITFRPDDSHPEGGTFFVTNQGLTGERPFIMEVELPLKSGGEAAKNLRMIEPGVMDLSALYWGPRAGSLLVMSDATNSLYRLNEDGDVLEGWSLTGQAQEGITLGPEGYMYIAQDTGGIIKIWPETLLGPRQE